MNEQKNVEVLTSGSNTEEQRKLDWQKQCERERELARQMEKTGCDW